jgi:hypothetical protein
MLPPILHWVAIVGYSLVRLDYNHPSNGSPVFEEAPCCPMLSPWRIPCPASPVSPPSCPCSAS